MIIDGEKYACEACVRGHRVSNCQHTDRKLQHINKKGRPVTQCSHCRTMRKSRASHVKCDCGEKTHKCVHLQSGAEGHRDGCCCKHGGRCTCSHKKEHYQLDTVPESDSEDEIEATATCTTSKSDARLRKRADTTRSEGSVLSFDSNGHHKPTHKSFKSSQKTGPYQLTRANSLQNRSVDNLSSFSYSENTANGVDTFGDRRKSKSTAGSPLMTGSSLAQLNGQLAPLDLSAIEYPPYVPNSADFFGNLSDHEQPIFSAGLSNASVDWSHYDGLDFAGKAVDFAPSNYSQPQSYGGFEFSGSEQLASLTTNTSNSGEVSEVEDFLGNVLDEFDANGGFGESAPSNSLNMNSIQSTMAGSTNLADVDFDELELKYGKTNNKFLPIPASVSGEDATQLDSSGTPDFDLEASEFTWDINGLQSGMPSMAEAGNDFWVQTQ